jgi:hypothetical protein
VSAGTADWLLLEWSAPGASPHGKWVIIQTYCQHLELPGSLMRGLHKNLTPRGIQAIPKLGRLSKAREQSIRGEHRSGQRGERP